MHWSKVLLWAVPVAAWTVEKAEVAVSGSGNVGERVPVSSLKSPVELFAGRSLDVAFKVHGAVEEISKVPQQTFLRLSVANAAADDLDKIIPARVRGVNGKIVVPFKQIPSALLNRDLKASLLISGHGSAPLESELFDLFVYGDTDEVLSSKRFNGYARQLVPKPEIIHQFPGNPRHVRAIVAIVFIVAIDVLFTLLLSNWLQVHKFTLPNSATRLTLLGLIFATELSFVLYYISWSIFSLISVLALLLPALVYTLTL